MALPYVTESQARVIAEKVVKESGGDTPVPSGGTKLYRHLINLNNKDIAFYIISWDSSPMTDNSFNLVVGQNCLSTSKELVDETWLFSPSEISYFKDHKELFVLGGSGGALQVEDVSFDSDTVTPL